MTAYERPSKRGQTSHSDYWATLYDYDKHTIRNSPPFDSQPQLMSWIVAHRNPTDEVTVMRRDVTPGGFKDHVQSADDEHEPPADLARLHALLGPLRDQLRADAKELKMPMRSGPRTIEAPRQPKKLDLAARAAARAKEQPGHDMLGFDEVYKQAELA